MFKPAILLISFVLSALILAPVDAVELEYRLCNGSDVERDAKSVVHSVSLEPCNTTTNGACDILAGGNATVVVNFSPTEKIGNAARQGLYWDTTVQMELRGLPKKACRGFVDCRLDANLPRDYTAVIPLKRSFPKRLYDVKVKLYLGSRKTYFCVIIPVNLK